jgi:hypothetical protein
MGLLLRFAIPRHSPVRDSSSILFSSAITPPLSVAQLLVLSPGPQTGCDSESSPFSDLLYSPTFSNPERKNVPAVQRSPCINQHFSHENFHCTVSDIPTGRRHPNFNSIWRFLIVRATCAERRGFPSPSPPTAWLESA